MVEFVNDPNFKDLVVDTTIDNRNDEEVIEFWTFHSETYLYSANDNSQFHRTDDSVL